MGRKDTPTGTPSIKSKATAPTHTPFPPIAPKADLKCHHIQPDQIILIPDVLSPPECTRLVNFVDQLPLQVTPPPRKGEADRVNLRISIPSESFAASLFAVLRPHLPNFPFPGAGGSSRRPSPPARPAHSFNSNIRLYKYTPAQYFGPHYDESVRDPQTGAKSEWTVLIYLTGEEDGVVGGETLFYKEHSKQGDTVRPPLRRGMALLHRHGEQCMLHEGAPVMKGVKYVLRTDVMFVA